MNLEQRIDLLAQLGEYCVSESPDWSAAKRQAAACNAWFTPEFIGLAVRGIATEFLQKDKLRAWADQYQLTDQPALPRTVGLVMAGNIPLVGFHDFLSIFISGHRQLIKPSQRDEALIRHLAEWLTAASPAAAQRIHFAERLNGCDAYIATGSNNSARYFDHYFGKYPSLIRRNRTSVAVLTGQESPQELSALADDVYQYFGLGCRNVTQLYVPENYDFLPLLNAFRKYDYLADLARYKHNYDYQLTLLILNKKYYLSNESILLTEDASPFSPISVLHYQYYRPGRPIPTLAPDHPDIQCVVARAPLPAGLQPPSAPPDHPVDVHPPAPPRPPIPALPDHNAIASDIGRPLGRPLPFGKAQQPGLTDYADGRDTLQFLRTLGEKS
jgi:hypothetical protein